MDRDELLFSGLERQAALIASGEVSSEELVSASLERIGRHDGLLNSFRVVLAEEALAEARRADSGGAGPGRPLHGVPVAIKNDSDVAGQATRLGSRATSDRPASADCEAVRRIREAGAIVIGVTNVPELTQWPFTESEAFGVSRNPWDPGRTPGGSSGGSAAAVAAGFVPAALGSDGGGSIRIPAACCGLFGIKPQRGRVPIAPKTDAWHGLSVLGPLARRVGDASLLLDVLADGAAGSGRFSAAAKADPGKLRVGFSARPPLPGPVGSEQRAAMERVAGALEGLGHSVAEIKPAYGTAIPAFVPRYLRGIADDGRAVESPDLLERRTKGMVRAGSLIPDSLLDRAMRAEPKAAARIGTIFDECDVFMTPGLAAKPIEVGRYRGKGAIWTFNGVARFTPFCAPWNMTGQPAAMVPAGFDGEGLPLSVQLVGRPDAEELLISLSAQIESALPWADRRPQLPA